MRTSKAFAADLAHRAGEDVCSVLALDDRRLSCTGGGLTVQCRRPPADRMARFEHARRFPIAFPGETFRGLYRAFYRDDAFAEGGNAVIDGHRYELSGLETPLPSVFARDDRERAAPRPSRSGREPPAGSNREHPGGHYDLLAVHRSASGAKRRCRAPRMNGEAVSCVAQHGVP